MDELLKLIDNAIEEDSEEVQLMHKITRLSKKIRASRTDMAKRVHGKTAKQEEKHDRIKERICQLSEDEQTRLNAHMNTFHNLRTFKE